MKANTDYAIRTLKQEAGHDDQLVQHLAGLINDVYAVAERGLWREGATRTTAVELAALIASEQIVAAISSAGEIVGSVRIRTVSDRVSEFGMLVSAPDQRGRGIGANLVEFAELHSREHGRHAMQLELLVPRSWKHPAKEQLKLWYSRLGYRRIGTRNVDDTYPEFAALLATPCHIEVHEKTLNEPSAAQTTGP